MGRDDTACHNPKHCRCREQGPAIRGFLIPCLLFLLKDKSSHGYQLIERLHSSAYLKEVPDPGVVYRHLRRLEQDNMVTSEFEPGDGPARKVYTLTPDGEAHMKTWIAELKTMNEQLVRFLSDTDRFKTEKRNARWQRARSSERYGRRSTRTKRQGILHRNLDTQHTKRGRR